MTEVLDRLRQHCNQCANQTWHAVLWSKRKTWTDDNPSNPYPVTGGIEHTVLQCCGCDAVSFQTSSWCSEDFQDDGSPEIHKEVYPPKTIRARPHWYGSLLLESFLDDEHFLGLLDEIYIALQNDCPRLAIMGIRALLEEIMIQRCEDQGTFKGNLKKFHELGYISDIQQEAIGPVLEAGHAAIHRSYRPKASQVLIALDITENIIESIFVTTEKAGSLRDKVPPRKKK